MIENVDKLITPMELTDDVLNTQFYDKVHDYKTLEYHKKELQIRNIRRKSQGTI